MIEERTPRQKGTSTRRTRPGRPSRARPLSDAARIRRSTAREAYLGPYETSYDIRDGYGIERPIVRP